MVLEQLSAGLVAATAAAAGGLLVPGLIARLPEPSPELPEPPVRPSEPVRTPAPAEPPHQPVAASTTTKPTYADLAARANLGPRCALASATLAGALGVSRGWTPDLPVWVVLAVLGVALGYIDWRTQLLPARLVVPAYPVVATLLLVASAVTWSDGGREAVLRAGIAWAVVFAVYFSLWFVHPSGLGYGDVRLSGMLGMALGWLGSDAVVVGTYAAFLLGAVVGGVLALAKVVDRKGYPFGPFMLVGAFLGVLHAGGDLFWWR